MTNKILVPIVIIALIVVAIIFLPMYFRNTAVVSPGSNNNPPVSTTTKPVACTMEAKMCPDGSYVGRQGPNCEFAQCPTGTVTPAPKSGDITLAVGQSATIGDLTMRLNSFVQDSRCPIDVQCIQAGAVVVNVTMTDKKANVTRNFPSDEVPYMFDGHSISIVSINPPRHSGTEVASKDYRIGFHVDVK